ncbi:MAG TPA: hypothetical protein VIK31_07745 [Propionibacteriaceae bacterium]
MALFRDRRAFPRWSFIDSRTLARPRRAKDENSAESVPTPDEPMVEVAPQPEPTVEATRAGEPIAAPEVEAIPEPVPARPAADVAHVSWIEERRAWFATGDWPTEASEEAVQLAATHPERPYTPPLHPGLPTDSPAEVRARHGRGFASLTRRHRRRRHGHEQVQRRTDIDLAALEAALDSAASTVGDGLVDLVVWHATTGLALASRGHVAPEHASLWHGATREVRATLPYADLPDAVSYHLVGLADRRLAVLLHANPDLGACVTVDLDRVAVNALLATAVPQLSHALAATSREY